MKDKCFFSWSYLPPSHGKSFNMGKGRVDLEYTINWQCLWGRTPLKRVYCHCAEFCPAYASPCCAQLTPSRLGAFFVKCHSSFPCCEVQEVSLWSVNNCSTTEYLPWLEGVDSLVMESLAQDWAWLLAGLLNTCCILWSKHWLKKGRGLLSSSLTTPPSYICFGRNFSKKLSLVIQSLPHIPKLPFIQEHQRCPVITTCLRKGKQLESNPVFVLLCPFWLWHFCALLPMAHGFLPAEQKCWFLFLCCLKYKVKQNTCSGRKEKIAGYA